MELNIEDIAVTLSEVGKHYLASWKLILTSFSIFDKNS